MNKKSELRELLDAIDANVETRVLLDKRDGERRIEHVVIMRRIEPAYRRARSSIVRSQ